MRGKLGQLLLVTCVFSFTPCPSRPLDAQVAGAIVTGAMTDGLHRQGRHQHRAFLRSLCQLPDEPAARCGDAG
jgi:hypothetical protein